MGFGIRLRGLWQMRGWVAACAAFASLAAVWSVADVSLTPPGLSSRSLKMASATTQVLVDTPRSAMVDIRQDTYGMASLTNRAVLLGNVMASPQVRADIARRAGIPVDALQIVPPLTPKQPRVLAEAGNQRHTSDIIKLNDQYRLYVQANPTVPFMRIFSQTPTAKSAAALANAAVAATQQYLAELAATARTPERNQIRLKQLGTGHGTVINKGIDLQVALIAFMLTFAVSCATVIWVRRVREGWRMAALSESLGTSA
jgi:hypothetical protein